MTNDELREKIAQAKGWTEINHVGRYLVGKHPSGVWSIPNYPNDIAAAWELVEEMYAMDFTVNVQRDYTGNIVYLTERGTGLYRAHIAEHADIAATAVCKAYLKLLEWKAAK